jgi:hypothetical protein
MGERSCSICRQIVRLMVERLMVMLVVLGVLVLVGGVDVIRWGLVKG